MPKSSCLILGANGFIGSHLVDKFARRGYAVRAFDRFSHDPQFDSHPSVEVIKGDATSISQVEPALKGVDCLVHSFSATTPASSDADPYTDLTENLVNSVRIFEKAASAGVKKIVFISSGGVIYGPLAEHKKAKETDLASPVSPYGISKLAIERYLDYFDRRSGIKHITFRLSNPYGPRQVTKNNQGVIPLFANLIKTGQPITVFGDGSSSRDYIYIEDAAEMISECFDRANHHGIYNLGSGKQTSLKTILTEIELFFGVSAKITHKDVPSTFLNKSLLDVSLIRNEFGLKAKTTFHQGIVKTLS